MKFVHVVPHIDNEASGPSYSVPMLCDALGKRNHQVELVTLARVRKAKTGAFAHHACIPLMGLHRLGVSPSMQRVLAREIGDADILHSHSLWMMPNVYPAWIAGRANKPLVVSPRGTLSPVALRRSSRRKKLFWTAFQGRALLSARLLHATSEQEYRDIRRFGLTQPVAVIPNGIEIPRVSIVPRMTGRVRRLLFLGRIHPIKGLESLLHAWARLGASFPEWELRIVGPGANVYVEGLRSLAVRIGLKRVIFVGSAFGAQKDEEYASADLFVLPSLSENFGMSVAEALAFGVPVVTTTGTPWQRVLERHCGWHVEPTALALENALMEAMSTPSTVLSGYGENGRAWMQEEYSWDRVAAAMEATYLWIAGNGVPPLNIRLL